MIYENTKKMKS